MKIQPVLFIICYGCACSFFEHGHFPQRALTVHIIHQFTIQDSQKEGEQVSNATFTAMTTASFFILRNAILSLSSAYFHGRQPLQQQLYLFCVYCPTLIFSHGQKTAPLPDVVHTLIVGAFRLYLQQNEIIPVQFMPLMDYPVITLSHSVKHPVFEKQLPDRLSNIYKWLSI